MTTEDNLNGNTFVMFYVFRFDVTQFKYKINEISKCLVFKKSNNFIFRIVVFK